MRLHEHTAEFKAWPEYWNEVYAGRKTAEVRVLTDAEWMEFCAADPKTIILTRTTDGKTLSRCITYSSSVAQVLGNHIVLICMWPGEVAASEDARIAALEAENAELRRERDDLRRCLSGPSPTGKGTTA